MLLDPMAFVRRPFRWIKALSEEAATHRTFAAAPNFAFELAAERGLPPEGDTLTSATSSACSTAPSR